MLRTKEERRCLQPQTLASKTVGVATDLLKHIPSKEMVIYTKKTTSLTEKVGRLTFAHWEHIIVEVEVLLIEPLDAVEMHLDRVTVEGWEKLCRDNIFV